MKGKLALAAVGLLAGFLLAEGLLRGLALAAPAAAERLGALSLEAPDPELGYRPRPNAHGHDSAGWRNPSPAAAPYAVALGDSQTYGAGVPAEDAWPRKLEKELGKPVYSMAFGGYGPVEELVLLEQAAALRPPLILTAFYAGNDFYDAFAAVHEQGRRPELGETREAEAKELAALQSREPLSVKVGRVYRTSRRSRALRALEPYFGRLMLFWALRKAGRTAVSPGHAPGPFTPRHRLAALDASDPRILEGRRITLEAFRKMAEQCRAKGMEFMVVLLPTKERAYAEAMREIPEELRLLVDLERGHAEFLRRELGRAGIRRLDAQPALSAAIGRGSAPYPPDADGHPNAAGHAVIAEAVARELSRAKKRKT
jgi:hypothetical protein